MGLIGKCKKSRYNQAKHYVFEFQKYSKFWCNLVLHISEEYQFQVGTDTVLYIRWKKFQRIFSGRATSVSRTFLEESLENVFYSTFKLDNDDEEKVDRREKSAKNIHIR